jgi:hypothetical protein
VSHQRRVNFVKAMMVYKEVGYPHVMMPEQVPYRATPGTPIKRSRSLADKSGRDSDWECMVGASGS